MPYDFVFDFPLPGLGYFTNRRECYLRCAENGLEGRQLSRDQKQFCQQSRLYYYN